MRRTKGFVSLLITVLLWVSLALPAQALPVINPDTPGSIRIYKYAADSSDNDQTAASGEPQEVTGLEPIANIQFQVTRVEDDTTNPAGAAPLEGEDAYSRVLATNTDGEAVFDNLKQGVYLVHELENRLVEAPVDDFLVGIPMTNPAGTDWIYDVYVYPKNKLAGAPSANMYVTSLENKSSPVGLGGSTEWIIQSDIPIDIAEGKEYQIITAASPYLSADKDSLVLYTVDSDGKQVSLEKQDDYILPDSGGRLLVDVTDVGREKLGQLVHDDFAPLLTLEYATTLSIPSESIESVLSQPVENSVELRYTNSLNVPSVSVLPDEAIPYVYTGGIRISKIDGRSDQLLDGAFFKIYTSLSDANIDNNAVETPEGGRDWLVETENGAAYFYGLAYGGNGVSSGEGSSTYYLVETQAPSGYNLLRAPVEVTVNSASHLPENAVIVRNYKGFTLPSTGGMGTLLFTVGGIALIGLAVFLLFRSSRKNSQK